MPNKVEQNVVAVIKRANILQATLLIRSTAPIVQCAFSQKIKEKMMHEMGLSSAERKQKGKPARPPRNYDEDFEQAQHKAVGGWVGIPCGAFRQAMVDACRTVDLVMTKAKMAITRILPDGFDVADGTPLIRIRGPRFADAAPPERMQARTLLADEIPVPERTEMRVINDNGSADIRIRPMWREWSAVVVVEFDADMITPDSIVNLLDRAGRQVGIGEGRPFSKNSCGMGWGTFTVVESYNPEEKVA